MSVALLSLSLLFAPAQAASAPKAPAPKAATADGVGTNDDSATNDDEVEFVGDDQGKQEDENDLPLDSGPKDTTPPSIDDIAIAVMNPDAEPVVTALLSDDNSGIEKAAIFVRKRNDRQFVEVPLRHNGGGMFIARIPGGLQKTGFFYYVEVIDAAGNGPALVGSYKTPLWVEPATVATMDRLAEVEESDGYRIHPALVMGVLTAGAVATVASGWFWYDYSIIIPQKRLQIESDTGVSETARNNFLAEVDTKALGDIAFGSILTGLGVAILGAGTTIAYFSLDE